jgi:hypothetical protein
MPTAAQPEPAAAKPKRRWWQYRESPIRREEWEHQPRPFHGWGALLSATGLVLSVLMLAFGQADYALLVVSFVGVSALASGIWWVMWREDFDGMRRQAAFERELESRPPLSVEQFYEKFYADSGLPSALVEHFLLFESEWFGVSAAKIRPQDNLFDVCECDSNDFVKEMEREFSMTMDDADKGKLSATFDSLLRYIARRTVRHPDVGQADSGSPPHARLHATRTREAKAAVVAVRAGNDVRRGHRTVRGVGRRLQSSRTSAARRGRDQGVGR